MRYIVELRKEHGRGAARYRCCVDASDVCEALVQALRFSLAPDKQHDLTSIAQSTDVGFLYKVDDDYVSALYPHP